LDKFREACLTCAKFVTDVTHGPELRRQLEDTERLVTNRQEAFSAKYRAPMGDDNVWLQGRRTEMDSLNRILLSITDRAVRSAGVTDQPHRSAIVPQHLRKAAQRQHDQATERATTALARLSTTGAAVSFASVAREPTSPPTSSTASLSYVNASNRCAPQSIGP
jgi:esterase/lipase superfamily enzyme